MDDERKKALSLLLYRRRNRARIDRRYYVRPLNRERPLKGEFSRLFDDLRKDQEKFFEFFRMSPQRFDHLHSLVACRIEHKQTHALPIDTHVRLAITVRMLASGESQSSLAIRYRMGHSTVCSIFNEVCRAIWDALKADYVSVPTAEDFKKISLDFMTNWNFPNCLGAIDGKHIRCKAPPNSGSLFYNYKGYFSTILMASGSVDANYKFSMVDVGGYGSQGDPGTFAQSRFGKDILEEKLSVPHPCPLPGTNTDLPYVFIGDEAFQMRRNMMRPFPKARLDDNSRIFNYRLSRARFVVENAFGILSTRWRILLGVIEGDPKNIDYIVLACVALHNYLKSTDSVQPPRCRYTPPGYADYEDECGRRQPGTWREETLGGRSLDEIGRQSANMRGRGSDEVREAFKRYFLSDVGRVPWQEAAALSC